MHLVRIQKLLPNEPISSCNIKCPLHGPHGSTVSTLSTTHQAVILSDVRKQIYHCIALTGIIETLEHFSPNLNICLAYCLCDGCHPLHLPVTFTKYTGGYNLSPMFGMVVHHSENSLPIRKDTDTKCPVLARASVKSMRERM